jgi:CDP-Glycerol:Poly(glycerophosphate) glycerophosphotransferase
MSMAGQTHPVASETASRLGSHLNHVILDRVWQFCKALENRFGYTRWVEWVCARLTWLALPTGLKRELRSGRDLVVVTCWMPAYLGNIEAVLDDLVARGVSVVIFPEWREKAHAAYTEGLARYSRWHLVPNAHRALPLLKAAAFVSSTATKHFYFSQTGRRFFYFHSVAGLKGFPEGGMDDYTDFLCATTQQVDELRTRFARLGLQRTLHPVGYPKFDAIVKRLAASRDLTESRTLLIAPSYASEDVYADVSMLSDLPAIVRRFIQEGWRVIFRPHPVSLQRGSGMQIIEAVRREFGAHQAFEFDDSQDYFRTYQRASLMLTDVSGTSLNYRLGFKKPVVFYSRHVDAAIEAFDAIPQLGAITSDLHALPALADGALKTALDGCSVSVFNPGRSARSMADVLVKELI